MPLPLLLLASLSHSKTLRAQLGSPAVRHYHRALRSEAVAGTARYVLLVPGGPRPAGTIKAAFPPALRAAEEREEQGMIAAINAERAERGLAPLAPDALLSDAARAHSREMCDRDYFDHRSPTPGLETPMARYLRALGESGQSPPDSATVGENVFYCSATSDVYNAGYAHQSLMDSPDHRANILEATFTKVGVGLYRDGQGRFWITEMFLRDQ